MRKNWVRSTLSQAVDQCRDEVYGLAEEMRDVFDRTPQVFQETTGKPREEAADWLEVASDKMMGLAPSGITGDGEVIWMEMRPGRDCKLFRPARRDNIVRCLRSSAAYLSRTSQSDDAVKLREELLEIIEILLNVYFPGVSGRRVA